MMLAQVRILRIGGVMSECGVASLTHTDRFQYSESRYFRLETAAFIAKDLTTIAAMVFPLVQSESERK